MDGQFNVYSVVDPAINISLKTEGSFLESAIVLNVKVFAVTNYGNFVVYDLEKAAFEKTKNPISFGVYGPLTVHNNNRLLFGDERKNLNVVDDNLENLRTLYIGTLFRSKPLIHDDRLFIGGLTEFVIVDVVSFTHLFLPIIFRLKWCCYILLQFLHRYSGLCSCTRIELSVWKPQDLLSPTTKMGNKMLEELFPIADSSLLFSLFLPLARYIGYLPVIKLFIFLKSKINMAA